MRLLYYIIFTGINIARKLVYSKLHLFYSKKALQVQRIIRPRSDQRVNLSTDTTEVWEIRCVEIYYVLEWT